MQAAWAESLSNHYRKNIAKLGICEGANGFEEGEDYQPHWVLATLLNVLLIIIATLLSWFFVSWRIGLNGLGKNVSAFEPPERQRAIQWKLSRRSLSESEVMRLLYDLADATSDEQLRSLLDDRAGRDKKAA
jgi:hypothetical protein